MILIEFENFRKFWIKVKFSLYFWLKSNDFEKNDKN